MKGRLGLGTVTESLGKFTFARERFDGTGLGATIKLKKPGSPALPEVAVNALTTSLSHGKLLFYGSIATDGF